MSMRKRWWVVVAIAVVLIGALVSRRHDVVRFAIGQAASLASGYRVRIEDQRIGRDALALIGVRVSHGGQPLLRAQRIEIRYSLRDLLPGSAHRFGLRSIAIDGATVTIVHYPNGSYNFVIPQGAPGPPIPQPVNGVPIAFTFALRDAVLELREPKAYDASAKVIAIRDFNASGTIDSARVTRYRASGVVHVAHADPFTIAGTIDALRGYALHHAHADRFPLRALANYFADTPAVRILAGHARNFDAKVYALDVRPNAAPSYHVGLQLDVDRGSLAFKSLAVPIDRIRGRLKLVDGAFFLNHLEASLAGIPIHVTGGIYDLLGNVTGGAQLRLGVSGDGDLSKLRTAFTFTRDQPVAGRIDLGVLVEGPVDNPLIVAKGVAPHASYRGLPFDALDAGIVYDDNDVALMPLHAYYGGTEVGIRGIMATGGPHVQSELALHMVARADRLPYLDEMLGREPLLVDAAAHGTDLLFHAVGAAASSRGVSRVAALIALDPNGTATVAPFWLHTERGNLDGGYVLDRPHGNSAFWAIASGLQMRQPTYKPFPGLDLPQMPNVNGRAVAMSIAGGGTGTDVALAGLLAADDTDIAGVKFDRVNAAFGGTLQNAAINVLHASGPWGQFNGSGAFSSQAFVARGNYSGTFEGLQPFLGSAIPGRGALSGTAAIALQGKTILVQGQHLAMRGATLHGVPIDDADITLGIDGDRLRVYSAHARAADGDVVAAGTFALAPGVQKAGALSLLAKHLDAAQLRGIGLPIDRGRLSASGDLAAGAPIPSFDGGVTMASARVAGYALSGGGDVYLAGDAAHLRRFVGSFAQTYGIANGTIGTLSARTPTYDLRADVPAGGIANAMNALQMPAYETDGTFNAALHVGGTGTAPSVSGHVAVPAGAINGLPFVDASADLLAGSNGVSVRRGSVTVGSTLAQFSAIATKRESAVHVASSRADLADFNNFFDTGDTLAGRGTVKLAAAAAGDRITSSGDVDVKAFRYRNLPIGNVRGYWSSARNVIDGSVAIGGDQGLLDAHGTIALSPQADLRSTFERSRYDLSAKLRDLDLSLWIPAVGFQSVPITGHASGDMQLRGRFPELALRGSASLTGGALGPLTLESARIAMHSVGTRIAIDDAEMTTPGLSATASGSFGFVPAQPLALQVHAATDNLPLLVHQLTKTTIPVRGSFESTLDVGGTLHAPTFSAGVDATNVEAYGIAIPSLFGEVRLHGRTIVLSNAGATFAQGEATLAGSLPLQIAPLRVGPANQPVSLDLDVVDLNPALFDAVLGHDTKLGGTINGHIGLSGTIGAPVLFGRASLTKGSYVSTLERVPIVNTVAVLAFDRSSATLQHASAQIGTGSVQGSGRAEFPRGYGGTSAVSFVAKLVAKGAQLDLPAYGSGTLDADVGVTKTPSSNALFAGSVTLSNATLPFASFVNAAAQASAAGGGPPLPIAFDLRAAAGKNVRIRGSGYGAGLDLGVTGSARLGGTLASPTLDGAFESTGGTLTYFDRAFRVQRASVHFDPADGVAPTLHAVAMANVVNPDPDRARNPYGSAEITIRVDGPLQGLNIGFTSVPAGYSRDQILALLAPFGGFIGGIGYSAQSALQVQQPGGVTPLGSLSPIPNVSQPYRSSITVGQEAFNLLNAQFAASLLTPVETALGSGLGLSSVNLTLGYYGNVGVTATRTLGGGVSAVYATTFGVPQIQSFGLEARPSADTSATLNFFVQTGPTRLVQLSSSPIGSVGPYVLGQPLIGTSGFSLTFQHHYW